MTLNELIVTVERDLGRTLSREDRINLISPYLPINCRPRAVNASLMGVPMELHPSEIAILTADIVPETAPSRGE